MDITATDLKSPLAIDMAISRVTVAALRASEDKPVNPADRKLAALLSCVLERELARRQPFTKLSNEMVPNASMRAQLEQTLSTMPVAERGYARKKPELLNTLVPLLNAFSDSTLETDRAREMVSELLNLSSQDEYIEEDTSVAASSL